MSGATGGGRLAVVGLGPGPAAQLTAEAAAALAAATDLFGYGPYLARLTLGPDQRAHVSDNREELARARAALALAAEGRQVAVVSGGDPGVFAMAAAVCEAVEAGPEAWRRLDVAVLPGVTAMLAVAARCGAPLGHDFAAISLSDNLKPWPTVERRLGLAAEAGFALALYNPVSRARPKITAVSGGSTARKTSNARPSCHGRAAGRPDERISVVPLAEAEARMADMATCVIVGSPATRTVPRGPLPPLVYTPRFAEERA